MKHSLEIVNLKDLNLKPGGIMPIAQSTIEVRPYERIKGNLDCEIERLKARMESLITCLGPILAAAPPIANQPNPPLEFSSPILLGLQKSLSDISLVADLIYEIEKKLEI